MQAFSTLLDRLSYEPRRTAKETLLRNYLQTAGDPDRGYALAALTGDLSFRHAKPAQLRELIAERCDPALFALSYDFVGDLSETIALLWPNPDGPSQSDEAPSLSDVILTLGRAKRADVPGLLAGWLDCLDETGRWALLKLITGGLRVGMSARSAKLAVARHGDLEIEDVEEIWHGLEPPYTPLFDWMEGRSQRPQIDDPAPFRPVMLAHPLDEQKDRMDLKAEDFFTEWKWDGIRVQAVSGLDGQGMRTSRLFSRSGDDISKSFPDIIAEMTFDAALDGELLILSSGQVRPFSDLQKRLNRKTAGPKLLAEFPAAIRAYDLLKWNGDDLRGMPFMERRALLEQFVKGLPGQRIGISAQVPVRTWEEITAARSAPETFLSDADAGVVEGLMLKRRDASYVAGRPKGLWFKWKRDPLFVDAVLMYAQRGHGKRSSFYSDYTFGVWRPEGREKTLVPVGKAYFGFTDQELKEIDRFVRNNTVNRFGPVREVVHTPERGLVVEVAFEGLNRSSRHKSGLAMRFPRIARLRWDKKPADADEIAALHKLLPPTNA